MLMIALRNVPCLLINLIDAFVLTINQLGQRDQIVVFVVNHAFYGGMKSTLLRVDIIVALEKGATDRCSIRVSVNASAVMVAREGDNATEAQSYGLLSVSGFGLG